MKPVFLLFCTLLLGTAVAQNIVPAKHLTGVVAFDGEFLYMAETEVSNAEYREFLTWLRSNNEEDRYQRSLPDTMKWMQVNPPYVKYYFTHSAYAGYPVVNVSQRQARRYCAWLQDRLHEKLKAAGSPIEKVIVRLPTEEEWKLAARKELPSGAPYPWEGETIRKTTPEKDKGMIQANVTMGRVDHPLIAGTLNANTIITSPVRSYWPNKIGLWNMSGNVAEWIDENARTKGGSWRLPPYHSRIDVPGYYDGDSSARPDIGFRYVIEVVSVKNTGAAKAFHPDKKYFKSNFLWLEKDSLYAQSTELSNREYLQFLSENDTHAYAINHLGWNRYFTYAYYQMYGWHEAYYDRPVVNITYESAVKYCEWLTVKYNSMEGREFKKVVFRLPARKEWEWAASGGRNTASYPWGGPYLMNSKASYLANFAPQEESYLARNDTGALYYNYPDKKLRTGWAADGMLIPGKTLSYFPNDYGLYNCSGNVAEMIAEKGYSCGGSWTSPGEYLNITIPETYTSPGPNLGFRVFMQVMEK